MHLGGFMDSLKVKDYMSARPVTFKADMSLSAALDKLLASNQTGGPVIDNEEHVVGFLSEQDMIQTLLKASYYCQDTNIVSDCMRSEVLTVTPEDTLIELAQSMSGKKPKVYPVTVDSRLVGIITRRDVLRAIGSSIGECAKHPV